MVAFGMALYEYFKIYGLNKPITLSKKSPIISTSIFDKVGTISIQLYN